MMSAAHEPLGTTLKPCPAIERGNFTAYPEVDATILQIKKLTQITNFPKVMQII
jgi:hypothetical protein